MKEILITSSVLIGALLLLRLLFAKKVSRRLIYSAWLLVALRLLIPVQIGQLDFSVLTAARPLTETVEEVADYRIIGQNERDASIQVTKDYIQQDQTVFTPEVQIQIKQQLDEGVPEEQIAELLVKTRGQEAYVPQVQQQVQEQVEEQTDFVSLGQVAKVIWLCGVGVMAIWLAVSNLHLARTLRKTRRAVECESPIPVYISDGASSPCLVGLLRPVVYLTPESAADENAMGHILTHELTHYAHKDHIWSLVRCICLCVYWFDPLVWVAAWLSRRDCELACDEGALKRLGEDARIEYGRVLLQVVSHATSSAKLLQTATAMNETKEQLKERVNFIVKRRKISITAAICMVLICAVIAGCAAAGAGNGSQTNVENPPLVGPAATTTAPPPASSTTQPAPTTQPTEPKPTEPKPTEPKPTEPKPTEPVNEELEKFNALFGDTDSWYNKALTCEYETPEQISLMYIFLNGLSNDASRDATDAEVAELKKVHGYSDSIDMLDVRRLPADQMNQVLQDYFGITLEDVEEDGFYDLDYLESTDCYYIVGNGASATMDFNAISAEYLEDGTIRMTYRQFTGSGSETFVAILMPYGDGYRILSNLRLA